jgi:hypothetical protein
VKGAVTLVAYFGLLLAVPLLAFSIATDTPIGPPFDRDAVYRSVAAEFPTEVEPGADSDDHGWSEYHYLGDDPSRPPELCQELLDEAQGRIWAFPGLGVSVVKAEQVLARCGNPDWPIFATP